MPPCEAPILIALRFPIRPRAVDRRLAAPAWADFQGGGVEAYLHGDYITAFFEFRPLAEQGDGWASIGHAAHGIGRRARDGNAATDRLSGRQGSHKPLIQTRESSP